MKLQQLGAFCLFSILVLAACGTVDRGTPPVPGTKPYQAAYEVPTGNLLMHQKQMCDGHGLFRFESGGENGQPLNVSIFDTTKHETTAWQEGSGQFIRRTMKPGESLAFDGSAMKNEQATSLGSKSIDGHNCHGWKSQGPGAITSEAWIDDDYGIIVSCTSGGPTLNATIKMTSFSKDAPSATMFQVPPGYTQLQLPAGVQ